MSQDRQTHPTRQPTSRSGHRRMQARQNWSRSNRRGHGGGREGERSRKSPFTPPSLRRRGSRRRSRVRIAVDIALRHVLGQHPRRGPASHAARAARPLAGPSHGLLSGERHALPEPRDAPSYILHREEAGATPRHSVARARDELNVGRAAARGGDAADGGRVRAHQRLGRPGVRSSTRRRTKWRRSRRWRRRSTSSGWCRRRARRTTSGPSRTWTASSSPTPTRRSATCRRAWTRKELEHQTAAEQRAAIEQAGGPPRRAPELAQERPRAGGQRFMDRFSQSLN